MHCERKDYGTDTAAADIVCSTMALILRPKYKECIPLWLLIFVFPILAYHNAGFIERENVSCLPNALCI